MLALGMRTPCRNMHWRMAASVQEVLLILCWDGGEWSNAKIALLTGSKVTVLLRPRPLATFSNPGTPQSRKRARHSNTVGRVIFNTRAIEVFGCPSAAARTMR